MSYGQVRLSGVVSLKERHRVEGGPFESLRLWSPRVCEAVTVLDSNDSLFRARVLGLDDRGALLMPFEEMGSLERLPEIALLQALPEGERMELIIQKASELGASIIIPFKSERSISLEERNSAQSKSHKWQEVALKAAKQSRSPFITEVRDYVPLLISALQEARGFKLKIALWERGGIAHLSEVLRGADGVQSVAVLTGPEGGFTEKEMEAASREGFVPVSMGQRVLRTETAAIAALSVLSYEFRGTHDPHALGNNDNKNS